jgi:AraC-like DNA-binding protein
MIDNTDYPFSAGRFFICPPIKPQCFMPSSRGKPSSYFAIVFYADETADADLIALFETVRKQLRTSKAADLSYRFNFEEIAELFRSGDKSLAKAADYYLESMFYRIYKDEAALLMQEKEPDIELPLLNAGVPYLPGGQPYETHTNPGIAASSVSQAHVVKAITIMRNQIGKNPSMEEIASELNITREHFDRVFKEITKLTPHTYFMRLKVESASGLLISTTKQIAEIGRLCGFEDQFSFSRMFKKYTSRSPLEYRNHFLQTVDFAPVPDSIRAKPRRKFQT